MHHGEVTIASLRGCFPGAVGVGLRRQRGGAPPPVAIEEAALLGPRAAECRRWQFALGRASARDALLDLGIDPAPIGRGDGGEPIWPAGVVGSITHTAGVAAAVVGRRTHFDGLGLDIERVHASLSAPAAARVCTQRELEWVRREGGAEVRALMVFSAKEALFKALYPIERVWLEFHDAELDWNDEVLGFVATLRRAAGAGYPTGTSLFVHCWRSHAEVITCTFAPAGGVTSPYAPADRYAAVMPGPPQIGAVDA